MVNRVDGDGHALRRALVEAGCTVGSYRGTLYVVRDAVAEREIALHEATLGRKLERKPFVDRLTRKPWLELPGALVAPALTPDAESDTKAHPEPMP